jgi:hypothetical protein
VSRPSNPNTYIFVTSARFGDGLGSWALQGNWLVGYTVPCSEGP